MSSKKCVAESATGVVCGLPADKKFGVVWMCRGHRSALYNFVRAETRDNLIGAMESNNCITRHTYGITYFIRLSNGNVKIGYVSNPQALCDRMQVLYQEYGGKVYLMATLYGGESMEALMHHKFRSARLGWFHNEQFQATNDLIAFCEKNGNVPAGKQAISLLKQKLSART